MKFVCFQFLTVNSQTIKLAKNISAIHHARWIGSTIYILKINIISSGYHAVQEVVPMFSFTELNLATE